MRAVAVVGSKGKEVTVVERECSASDRLDTRREAEVSVVWGRGTADGEAEETRRRAPMGSARGSVGCVSSCYRSGAATHEKPPASDVAEQGCFIGRMERW